VGLAAVFVGLAASASEAPGEIVERVVAVVGKEPILLSEARAQLELALESLAVDPSDSAAVAEIREQMLEQLIEQQVLFLEAEARGIVIGESDVSQAVDGMIAQSREGFGSEELFQLQLRQEGLTLEDLRGRFARQARKEIAIGQLIRRQFPDEPQATDEEIRHFYDEHRDEIPRREAAVHLQHILIRVVPDSLILQKAHDLAAEVAGRIRSGEISFAEAARRYSDDPNGREGGDLHRISPGDFRDKLGPAFEDTLFALDPGRVSEPQGSPLGFHLLLVHEKDPDAGWVHASHVLFGVPVLRADETRAEERAREIYGRARDGEEFDELARRYSDDPLNAERGGDAGWIPVSAFEEDLARVVDSLRVGQFSEPIPAEGAFHLFRLLGRESERVYAFEEVAPDLASYVRAEKRQASYTEWVAELKQRYYIERRSWE
jgi:peptidyl-prolyl cis-trans isomerase SurA